MSTNVNRIDLSSVKKIPGINVVSIIFFKYFPKNSMIYILKNINAFLHDYLFKMCFLEYNLKL